MTQEVDRLALRLAPMDVVPVARRAVDAFVFSAWQQGKVEVRLETTEAELWAVADEQRLLQVLMNLLHNGVRHTLPGGIVVVGLSSQPEAIVIQVQDSGEGISPADLPYIWERFYRGQSRADGARAVASPSPCPSLDSGLQRLPHRRSAGTVTPALEFRQVLASLQHMGYN
jgi:signal transduction histidine kinase